MSTMTGDRRLAQEMADREHQASALAAAGMVAESVSVTGSVVPQGLQAPPPLAGAAAPMASTSNELDSINWNLMDLGAMHLDDMDMDFAQLFDPASELAGMQTEGSGWPTSSPQDTKPPPTAPNTSS